MCKRCWFANDDVLEKRIQRIQDASSLQKHNLNVQKKMRTFLSAGTFRPLGLLQHCEYHYLGYSLQKMGGFK